MDETSTGNSELPTRLKKPVARASLTIPNATTASGTGAIRPSKSDVRKSTQSVFDRLHDDQRKRDARAQRQREIQKMREDALYANTTSRRSTPSRQKVYDSSRYERESSASGSSALIDIDGVIPGEQGEGQKLLQPAVAPSASNSPIVPSKLSLEKLRRENEALSQMLKWNKRPSAGGYPSLQEIQRAQRSAASVPIPPSPQPHCNVQGASDLATGVQDVDVQNASSSLPGNSLADIQERIDRISKSIGDIHAGSNLNSVSNDGGGNDELAVTLRAASDSLFAGQTSSETPNQTQQGEQITEVEEDELISRLRDSIASISSLRAQVQKGSADIDEARLKKERCFALMEVLDGKVKNLEEIRERIDRITFT